MKSLTERIIEVLSAADKNMDKYQVRGIIRQIINDHDTVQKLSAESRAALKQAALELNAKFTLIVGEGSAVIAELEDADLIIELNENHFSHINYELTSRGMTIGSDLVLDIWKLEAQS